MNAADNQPQSHTRASLRFNTHCGESTLTYRPIDDLVESIKNRQLGCELLLIDEAASIPLHLLDTVLEAGVMKVFTTTVHGYEGSGSGFSIRFKRQLEQRFAELLHIELSTPIRWAEHDMLESIVFDVLVLNTATDANRRMACARSEKKLSFELFSQSDMRRVPWKAVFSLLASAHYQTRPLDLMRLMDIPGQHLLLAFFDASLVGAVWLVEEGYDAEDALLEQIALGNRRPKGHLVPNSMLAHEGIPDFIHHPSLRISRIAVAPGRQGQAIGSRLLGELRTLLRKNNYSARWLSVSFGAEARLLRFWLNNGFRYLRLGTRPNASSSKISIMMGVILVDDQPAPTAKSTIKHLPISEAFQLAERKISKTFIHRLPKVFDRDEKSLLDVLFLSLPRIAAGAVDPMELRDVCAFAFGHRQRDSCEISLRSCMATTLFDAEQISKLSEADRRLLLLSMIYEVNIDELKHEDSRIIGKRALDDQLRRVFRKLLSEKFADLAPTGLLALN